MRDIKYCVRKNTQLTRLTGYVYCKDEVTADAVAACFNNKSRDIARYTWVFDGPGKEAPHWCVVEDVPWAIASSKEVRPGQWFAGIWDDYNRAKTCLETVLNRHNPIENFAAGVGPIQDTGCVLVNTHEHAHPVEVWCRRYDLKLGECFEYLSSPGYRYVCAESQQSENIPSNWRYSTRATSIEAKTWDAKVKRIPRWDNKPGPVVLPCINPMEDHKVNGMPWKEILYRYTEAQKHEAIHTNTDGKKYVGRHGAELDPEQFAAATKVWQHALAQAQAAAVTREHNRIVCDPVDEMPNMAYVPDCDE